MFAVQLFPCNVFPKHPRRWGAGGHWTARCRHLNRHTASRLTHCSSVYIIIVFFLKFITIDDYIIDAKYAIMVAIISLQHGKPSCDLKYLFPTSLSCCNDPVENQHFAKLLAFGK